MNEKIAWYKEILELEPSSKIFFPLARLLHKDGHTAYAIEVLRTGLAYHKDFFEARLMLIELLHQTGSSSQCDIEVRSLLASFAAYPQFWNAWSACLSHDGAHNDVSLAMRFIAASQNCSDISLASLLDKGLKALEEKKSKQTMSVSSDVVNEPFLWTASNDMTFSEAEEFSASAARQKVSKMDLNESIDSGTSLNFTQAVYNAEPTLAYDNIMPTCETVQSVDYADFLMQERKNHASQDAKMQNTMHSRLENLDVEQDIASLLANQKGIGEDSSLASFTLLSSGSMERDTSLLESTNLKEDICCTLSKDYHHEMESLQSISLYSDIDRIGPSPSDELFTLCTRSMAEVLTAQGDIQGALSIYDELLLTEKSEAIRHAIQERVDVLRHKKACCDMADGIDEPCPGREKVLQMLTLLAERLDSRAQ